MTLTFDLKIKSGHLSALTNLLTKYNTCTPPLEKNFDLKVNVTLTFDHNINRDPLYTMTNLPEYEV